MATATMAKRNPINYTTTFYVQSQTEPGKTYMVLRIVSDIAKKTRKTLWFCQCSDFFGRKLAHFGTNTFSGCKHINAAKKESGEKETL